MYEDVNGFIVETDPNDGSILVRNKENPEAAIRVAVAPGNQLVASAYQKCRLELTTYGGSSLHQGPAILTLARFVPDRRHG